MLVLYLYKHRIYKLQVDQPLVLVIILIVIIIQNCSLLVFCCYLIELSMSLDIHIEKQAKLDNIKIDVKDNLIIPKFKNDEIEASFLISQYNFSCNSYITANKENICSYK